MALLAAIRSARCSRSQTAVLSVLQAQLPSQTASFGSHSVLASADSSVPSSRRPHSLPNRAHTLLHSGSLVPDSTVQWMGSIKPETVYVGVAWIQETLALVRRSAATRQSPLVKEHLWAKCDEDDSCSVPTRRVLSDSLNWLRQNQYVQTAKSGVLLTLPA